MIRIPPPAAPSSTASRARLGIVGLGTAFLLVAIGAPGCARHDRGTPGRPAPSLVVLVSLDTLRPNRLGTYGSDRPTSPHLDALARDAVVFTSTAAQIAHTLPSHKSLFTSKYPYRLLAEATHTDLAGLAALENPTGFLDAAFAGVTEGALLDELRAAGYRTVGYTDGGWMSRDAGFGAGFDRFDDRGGHLAGILARVVPSLRSFRRQPTFLFLHAYDVHCPYVCAEPYNSLFCPDHSRHIPLEGRCGYVIGNPPLMQTTLTDRDLTAISDHYDGGIAAADAELGRFVRRLREAELYDDALIVFTSDHGEALGEHGHVGHGGLHVEQLLVPLLIKFPASWSVSPHIDTDPVALLDILPTVLDACGADTPPALDGLSLLPRLDGEPGRRDDLISQIVVHEGRMATPSPTERAILVPDRWLLIHDARTDSTELFDLERDGTGRTRVTEEAVETELLERLQRHDGSGVAGEPITPEAARLREETRRQLESLGYTGD